MYAVMLNQPTILSALLRRGADPNVEVQQEVSELLHKYSVLVAEVVMVVIAAIVGGDSSSW